MSKILTIKSYSTAGVFVKIITDATFESFRKTINGGLSDLTLKLARKIDNFNTASDVTVGNRIEIWVYDEESGVPGILLYSGYIEQQNMVLNGGEEYVNIVCYGTVAKLNNDVLKETNYTRLYTKLNDGLTTTSASKSAAEVSDVIRAIIDRFNIANPDNHIYSDETGTDTITDSGNEMAYEFNAIVYFNALEICRNIAPQNWYWFLDSENYIHFKEISAIADHTFLLSKDVARIQASKAADSIKNVLLLFDGNATYKQYYDTQSIDLYGRRVKQITDSNIQDTATMDNIGASFLGENKDPKVRLEIDIIDSNESDKGYDIESIDPGDTCKITGITPDGQVFSDNMVIKEVMWTLGKATLTIETEKDFDISRFILDIKKQVDNLTIDSGAMPEQYT